MSNDANLLQKLKRMLDGTYDGKEFVVEELSRFIGIVEKELIGETQQMEKAIEVRESYRDETLKELRSLILTLKLTNRETWKKIEPLVAIPIANISDNIEREMFGENLRFVLSKKFIEIFVACKKDFNLEILVELLENFEVELKNEYRRI